MAKGRLEAFSDGVIAIIITIMVLELRPPHGAAFADLAPLHPIFLSYVLSFITIGLYWNNHHHMFHAVQHVNGPVLWANLHLLFWLSLFPFVTAWMGESHFAAQPVALYGVVAFLSGMAYYILVHRLIKLHGRTSPLGVAIGKDMKGLLSLVFYAVGVGASLIHPKISLACYVAVALMWLIPDRRIEKVLHT